MDLGGITAPATLPAYCERTGPGPWSEPLDAVSNLAFLLAAAVALLAWRRIRPRDWPLLFLAAAASAIGFGSLAFHVAPSPLTWAADVWPIRLFALGYLWLALRRQLGAGWMVTLGGIAALAASTVALTRAWPGALAGGVGYFPLLAALALLGGWSAARPGAPVRRAAGRGYLVAAACLAAALLFRTIDLPACAVLPTGTHFLWHLLTGLTVGVLLLAQVPEAPGQSPNWGGPPRPAG